MNSRPQEPVSPASAPRPPSVTVVMPCFNAQDFIGAALSSVLEQDYEGVLEIFVVDDGSSDDSVAVAKAFAQVTVIRQANRGPAAARNRAIELASGELIAFLDADDVWTPNSLQARVDILLAEPDIDVVFGDLTQWFATDGEAAVPAEATWTLPAYLAPALRSGWLYPFILLDTIISIITALVRRRVFEQVGLFDETLRMGEDYDFWIRVAQDHRFRKTDQVVARYRRHEGGTTMLVRNEICEYDVAVRALARHGLRSRGQARLPAGALERRLSSLCFDHGYFHYWHGDARIAARSFTQALGHQAWHGKALAYWLLSWLKVLRRRSARPGQGMGLDH